MATIINNRVRHKGLQPNDLGEGKIAFKTAEEANVDASKRSRDVEKFPHGVDAFYCTEFETWASAPMLGSRGLDKANQERRYRAGKAVDKENIHRTFRDFGPRVSFTNIGIGVDGLSSCTITCAAQDFSYRDLQEFAQQLLKLADEMARTDRRQIKAETSAALTNSKN
jgi:hypothetical protein